MIIDQNGKEKGPQKQASFGIIYASWIFSFWNYHLVYESQNEVGSANISWSDLRWPPDRIKYLQKWANFFITRNSDILASSPALPLLTKLSGKLSSFFWGADELLTPSELRDRFIFVSEVKVPKGGTLFGTKTPKIAKFVKNGGFRAC